mmetsp:Transcript_26712/g.54001  ORF Transcript_26712/g.54001 Transcript_26712/m.54001 type:complete len:93 (+) Transcript_26712:457-735(+)
MGLASIVGRNLVSMGDEKFGGGCAGGDGGRATILGPRPRGSMNSVMVLLQLGWRSLDYRPTRLGTLQQQFQMETSTDKHSSSCHQPPRLPHY